MVEQRPFKALVVGSSPTQPTVICPFCGDTTASVHIRALWCSHGLPYRILQPRWYGHTRHSVRPEPPLAKRLYRRVIDPRRGGSINNLHLDHSASIGINDHPIDAVPSSVIAPPQAGRSSRHRRIRRKPSGSAHFLDIRSTFRIGESEAERHGHGTELARFASPAHQCLLTSLVQQRVTGAFLDGHARCDSCRSIEAHSEHSISL